MQMTHFWSDKHDYNAAALFKLISIVVDDVISAKHHLIICDTMVYHQMQLWIVQ